MRFQFNEFGVVQAIAPTQLVSCMAFVLTATKSSHVCHLNFPWSDRDLSQMAVAPHERTCCRTVFLLTNHPWEQTICLSIHPQTKSVSGFRLGWIKSFPSLFSKIFVRSFLPSNNHLVLPIPLHTMIHHDFYHYYYRFYKSSF